MARYKRAATTAPMDANVKNACPAAELLAAFAAGQLGDDDMGHVAEHLEGCSSCLRAVARPDPFTQKLKRIHQEGVTPWSGGAVSGAQAQTGAFFFNVSNDPPTND